MKPEEMKKMTEAAEDVREQTTADGELSDDDVASAAGGAGMPGSPAYYDRPGPTVQEVI